MFSRTVTTLVAVVSLGQCVPAFSQYTWYEYDGHSYALTVGSGQWWQAALEAANAGGHLVTINDQSENDWLLRTFQPLVPDRNVAIGLFQDRFDRDFSEPAGGWKWVNGEPLAFTNWSHGEPNNFFAPEDFGVFWLHFGEPEEYRNGQWNDGATIGVTEAIRGIIEVPVPEPTSLLILLLGGTGLLVHRRPTPWQV